MIAAQPERLILERLDTPLGAALVVTDEAGAVRAFNWRDFEAQARAWLGRRYPSAELTEGAGPDEVRAAISAYFAGRPDALSGLAWRTAGTAFQLAVWRALCTIPPGETLSYAGLAARIGRPTAMRAVGLANGSNPISLIVPCHRVIGADGTLTGYGGGLARKRWLLAHEGASFRDRLAA